MSQFEVPQFIELESKIVGPLTLKQFGFIAAPALISFFLFFTLNTVIWVMLTIILVVSGVSFAFIKLNGRPLYMIAFLGIKYFWQPKMFLWKRPITKETIAIPEVKKQSVEAKRSALDIAGASLTQVSKLWQDLTTTKNPIPKREKTIPRKSISEIQDQYQVFRRMSGEKQVARRVDYR
jgi:hypothetical protein